MENLAGYDVEEKGARSQISRITAVDKRLRKEGRCSSKLGAQVRDEETTLGVVFGPGPVPFLPIPSLFLPSTSQNGASMATLVTLTGHSYDADRTPAVTHLPILVQRGGRPFELRLSLF